MESSFSSPRNDTFPAGLRVLVVDDDPTWLKILEKMLKKCSYDVTTCGLARDALHLLRQKKDGYDIVISDVNMPDMDGFRLLEHVGLEMDLPVIMMSVDGETSRVMRGVQHGACDYLLKPIRMKELRNIWQHVFRKKIHEIRDIESHESFEGIQLIRSGSDQYDDGYFLSAEDLTSSRKRKDADNKYDDKDFADCSSTKKARVVWSVDLHQKFVKAVHQIGFDKVGPKKILDLMNVPWLTRENVASHLQKYRLYLSRLQKGNELKSSCGGTKHSDYSSKDAQGSFGLQNSISIQQSDVAHGSFKVSGKNLASQRVGTKSHESDINGIVSEPVAEPKKGSNGNIPDSQKTRSSQMDFNNSYAETRIGLIGNVPDSQKIRTPQVLPSHSIASVASEVNHQAFEAISTSTANMENQGLNLNCITDLESAQRNLIVGSASPFASLDDGFQICWYQGDCYGMNLGLQNLEFLEYNDPALVSEVPAHLYDALRFDYPCEPSEYSVIGQGLFIS